MWKKCPPPVGLSRGGLRGPIEPPGLYESAAERASQAESKIRQLEKRIWQLEQEVLDWKAVALGCQTTYGKKSLHSEASYASEHTNRTDA